MMNSIQSQGMYEGCEVATSVGAAYYMHVEKRSEGCNTDIVCTNCSLHRVHGGELYHVLPALLELTYMLHS